MSWRVLSVTGVMIGLFLLWIAASYTALTNGINELYESVSGSALSVSQDERTSNNRQETGQNSDVEPFMEVGGMILLGVSSAFWAFRRLGSKVRGRGRNVCLLVLMFSFVLCAYGFGLLLELAAESG
ncbi:MAG: hypothetical protein WAN65_19075 [Candidatus Sulfotelmatobacter sp.]